MAALADHVSVKIGVQLNLLNPNASFIALGNNCPDTSAALSSDCPRKEIDIGLGRPGFPRMLAMPRAIS